MPTIQTAFLTTVALTFLSGVTAASIAVLGDTGATPLSAMWLRSSYKFHC